jgi:hypothetical protein
MGGDKKGSVFRVSFGQWHILLEDECKELEGRVQGFPDGFETFHQEGSLCFPAALRFQGTPGLDAGIVHAGDFFHTNLS